MNNDDIRKVTEILQERLSHGLDQRDVDVVQRQLGRFPRGMVAVGARCVCGNPLAVITRPLVEQRIPFPTTCYLTSPEAVKAVSRLEADGDMTEYTRQVQDEPEVKAAYERAHEMYLEFRHQLAERLGDDESHIAGISAGGMPVRVKCLHALTGQALVMGGGVNPIADDVLRRVKAQFDPSVCRCSVPYGIVDDEEANADDHSDTTTERDDAR